MSNTTPTSWIAAWNDARARIQDIQQELANSVSPSPRVLRVGQLDAELLDAELVQLLREPISKALSLVNSNLRSRFDDELVLFVSLALYKLSVWDSGASYGAKLQGLRYQRHSPESGALTRSGVLKRIILVHSALTVVVPYLHSKLRSHALSRSWPDAPLSDRGRRAWDALLRLETLHSTMSLFNFIAFLFNGRYRTLADRLLRLRLVSTQHITQRAVSYEFMNRQMVWHAFSEFLLFLLPIVNLRTIRRTLRNIATSGVAEGFSTVRKSLGLYTKGVPTSGQSNKSKIGKWHNLSTDQCAICADNAAFDIPSLNTPSYTAPAYSSAAPSAPNAGQSPSVSTEDPPNHPINTGYMTSCGHLYCYVCLSDAMLRARDDGGSPWECLRCAQPVTWSERAEVDGTSSVNDGSIDEYEFTTIDTDSLGDSIDSMQTFEYTNSEPYSP